MSRRFPVQATGAAVALVCIVACGGAVSDPVEADFSGTYQISASHERVDCSPNGLPSPLLADTAQYVHVPADRSSSLLSVEQSGTNLSITPLDATGRRVAAEQLRGSVDPSSGIASTSRIAEPRQEGPREDGHTFWVSEASWATTRFQTLLDTPVQPGQPAAPSGMVAVIVDTDTLVFRDGAVAGPIFTTCVAIDSVVATRRSTT